MPIPEGLHRPQTPGLFVVGADTGVGKTVVTCLIADQLRRRTAHQAPRSRIGVLKPFATGCRKEREGLVSDDSEQLAVAADFDPDIGDLDLITPIRFRPPVAPAVALEQSGQSELDWGALDRSLRRLDDRCDVILIEGVGGLLVPLEQFARNATCVTVLDVARVIGFPVIVVTRAGLGTLNHTAMTCELIRRAGLSLAGIVINAFEPDSPDASQQTNRQWLARQNNSRILATLPGRATIDGVIPRPGGPTWSAHQIPNELREAIDVTDFAAIARPGRAPQP